MPLKTRSSKSTERRFAFSVVTALFFAFGFITCLNDILVPHLKELFTLSYAQAALVQFSFFSAYFVASTPSGWLVARIGYQRSTVVGLMVTALGCLLFFPAAGLRSYAFFLFGLFVLASGVTLIQVAVNPYTAVLGPPQTASARLNLAQAFNSLGTTLAPLFGTAVILSNVSTTVEHSARTLQIPYLGLSAALVALAVIVGVLRLPEPPAESSLSEGKSLWKYRHLILGTVGIFAYVGAEVTIGSYLIHFLGLPQVMAFSPAVAGRYVSVYWGLAMVGRFLGAGLLQRIAPQRVLAGAALSACLLLMTAISSQGQVAMVAVLAIGFFNSIQFPTIFTLAIAGVGKQAPRASGLLCMAIVGGAVIPLLQGWMADRVGLQSSFVLSLLCYAYILYYGGRGYRVSRN